MTKYQNCEFENYKILEIAKLALERKVEKGYIMPEYINTGNDGHYDLKDIETRGELDTDVLIPHKNDWDRVCTHSSVKLDKH